MMLKIRLVLLILIFVQYNAVASVPDTGVVPKDLKLDQRWNYNNYTHLVLPTIDWLQSHPISSNKIMRNRHNNFLMFWLQKNEDVTVHMPEYLLKFQNVSNELYFLYVGAWIENDFITHDTTRRGGAIAAINGVLDYYEDSAKGIPRSEYMNHLLSLRDEGKIPGLFDTSSARLNTYVFLSQHSDKHEYKPNENYFSFRYNGINLTNTKALHYRYKLEGYYDKWIATGDEIVTFPKLPPGSYIFRVQASVLPGFDNAPEDSYTFSIARPVYQQPWFIALITLLAVTGMVTYISRREKRLKYMANLKHDRVVFEYEYLKSQVNPHFLFNSLNTLTSLIEESPGKAVVYTSHLSDLYRNMLAHPESDLVLLAEELDILNNYVHIQKTRFGEALKLALEIPADIMADKKVVYLSLQLLVENAIKHNVVSLSQPLSISIVAEDGHLVVSNPIQKKISKEKGNGVGLVNISKRYALATDKPVWYGEVNKMFIVRLPLL